MKHELVWGIGKLSKMSRIWVEVEEQRMRCSRMRRRFESGSNDDEENDSFGRQRTTYIELLGWKSH